MYAKEKVYNLDRDKGGFRLAHRQAAKLKVRTLMRCSSMCRHLTSIAQHHFLVIIIDESQRIEIELGALDKEREKDKAYVLAFDCVP